eukprot:TRINITY_DN14758_c0_g1_i1.p1 TRINITY_DN14758_c0_g1~~TRINITY_DN14758_c0_g1_i1.p1  ORF type:complete len:500 (+),score=60.77 TRINITY_DN14758_c0_g1_i1:375-1874(+)
MHSFSRLASLSGSASSKNLKAGQTGVVGRAKMKFAFETALFLQNGTPLFSKSSSAIRIKGVGTARSGACSDLGVHSRAAGMLISKYRQAQLSGNHCSSPCRHQRTHAHEPLFLNRIHATHVSGRNVHPIFSGRIRRGHVAATGLADAAVAAEPLSVSIIVPVYNEVGSISILVKRITEVMKGRGSAFEIICVDDGSTDGTTQLLQGMAGELEHIRAVIFRRNFGQTAAIAAGFDYAVGDVFVTLDGDLQNNPEDIPKLLDVLLFGRPPRSSAVGVVTRHGSARYDGGFDMVCSWRRERKDAQWARVVPSKVANWVIGRVTGLRLNDSGSGLKALRAPLAGLIRLYGESHRLLPALAAMEGAAIAEVEVSHSSRKAGVSKYSSLGRTPAVLADLLTVCLLGRFRDRAMHLFAPIAFLCCTASFLFSTYSAAAFFSAWTRFGTWRMALPVVVPYLVAAMELLIMGVQVLLAGLVAEMCSRTYFESQGQRLYKVREVVPSTY